MYEAFSWDWTPKEAKKTSQRYTPRNIAVTLLEEVFDGIPDSERCRCWTRPAAPWSFPGARISPTISEEWEASKAGKATRNGIYPFLSWNIIWLV